MLAWSAIRRSLSRRLVLVVASHLVVGMVVGHVCVKLSCAGQVTASYDDRCEGYLL